MQPHWPSNHHDVWRLGSRQRRQPPPPWLAQSPLYSLSTAGRAATLALGRTLEPLGLTMTEFATLAVIATIGPVSQRTTALRLSLDRTSMSELIAAMDTRGYLSKQRDDRDRRRWLLSITEAGAQQLETVADPVADAEQFFFRRLARPERERLCALLDTIFPIHLFQPESRSGQ